MSAKSKSEMYREKHRRTAFPTPPVERGEESAQGFFKKWNARTSFLSKLLTGLATTIGTTLILWSEASDIAAGASLIVVGGFILLTALAKIFATRDKSLKKKIQSNKLLLLLAALFFIAGGLLLGINAPINNDPFTLVGAILAIPTLVVHILNIALANSNTPKAIKILMSALVGIGISAIIVGLPAFWVSAAFFSTPVILGLSEGNLFITAGALLAAIPLLLYILNDKFGGRLEKFPALKIVAGVAITLSIGMALVGSLLLALPNNTLAGALTLGFGVLLSSGAALAARFIPSIKSPPSSKRNSVALVGEPPEGAPTENASLVVVDRENRPPQTYDSFQTHSRATSSTPTSRGASSSSEEDDVLADSHHTGLLDCFAAMFGKRKATEETVKTKTDEEDDVLKDAPVSVSPFLPYSR